MPKSLSKKKAHPVVVVLVGEKLSGKEEASRYLVRNYGFTSYRFSKALVDILERLHLPLLRAHEMNLAGALRERFGSGVLAEAIKAEIVKKKIKRVVIDGMRHPAEFEILKSIPGFLLVYLTAPLDIRYQRARKRGERVGEATFSRDEFKREEKWVTEIFIRRIGSRAAVKLVNDGSLAKLHKQIEEKIVKKYL